VDKTWQRVEGRRMGELSDSDAWWRQTIPILRKFIELVKFEYSLKEEEE